MEAVDIQFRSALTFAFAWLIARVIASPLMDKAIDVTPVVLTYLGIVLVAFALYHYVREVKNVKAVRALCFIVLGAYCAAATQFW